MKIIRTAFVLALFSSASVALAAEAGNDEAITKGDVAAAFKPQFSPYAGRHFPTRPLFGDTHLHNHGVTDGECETGGSRPAACTDRRA